MMVDRVADSNGNFFPLPALLLALVALVAPCGVARPQSPASAPPAADINRDFLDPELDPEAWVAKFEVESREVFVCREAIVEALGVEPGDRVADVGSGTGLFLGPLAEGVGPGGRVYAVDISPRLVDFLERRTRDEDLGNVAVILSTDASTGLPAASVGRVLVCDAYHHFVEYEAMLASIKAALVPGGELVVVDFDRVPGRSRQWLLDHVRADKETVRGEIEGAGFEFVEEVAVGGFRENYLLRFRRPADGPAGE